MKKVLIVLAFVAVYGVSLAMTQATPMVSVDEIVVVDDNVEKEEGKKATAKAKGEKPAEGCSGAKADAKGCSGAKADAKACSGEKSAEAKKDCASSCGGK